MQIEKMSFSRNINTKLRHTFLGRPLHCGFCFAQLSCSLIGFPIHNGTWDWGSGKKPSLPPQKKVELEQLRKKIFLDRGLAQLVHTYFFIQGDMTGFNISPGSVYILMFKSIQA